jgi:putative CocE/NonD family hydrolase
MALASDAAPWLPPKPKPLRALPMRSRSLYLTMRDGVRIALDVHLPAATASSRLPTIVRQTRYFRGIDFREPWRRLPIDWLFDHPAPTRRRFVSSGYAWVDVCARGSGASFGSRPCPWSPDEVADGAEVVDWIVAQPWSNGMVGTTGVSYDGTASDFLLTTEHPALKASAPRFSLFDVYADVAFPGGIHLAWFTEQWSRFNRDLDQNRLDLAFSRMLRIQIEALGPGPVLGSLSAEPAQLLARWLLRRIASGVRPADSARGRALLARALESHRENFDVHKGALAITHRDDSGVSPVHPEESIDLFSPHRYAARLAGGAAILSISGWLDGGYPHSAIKRFRTCRTPDSRLILGPWDHGGLHDISPFSPSAQSAYDHDGELLAFFDRHLRGEERSTSEPPVRYFTIGEECWKSASEWPPPQAIGERWYLNESGRLAPEPSAAGIDEHRVDRQVGTGRRSRWVSLLGLLPPAGYGDRAALGPRLLLYRSAPLDTGLEVTGHPILTLYASFDSEDAQIFAYLEDEAPDGRVRYVTEGQLRALHRKLSDAAAKYDSPVPYRSFERADAAPLSPGEMTKLVFDLQPISWWFGRGHRLRLALAGVDVDHFATLPHARTWGVHRGGSSPSHVELPVIR